MGVMISKGLSKSARSCGNSLQQVLEWLKREDVDMVEARKQLEAEAEAGPPAGMLLLARLHLQEAFGAGYAAEALMWAQICAEKASTQTLRNGAEGTIRRAVRKLSPAQLAEVDRWVTAHRQTGTLHPSLLMLRQLRERFPILPGLEVATLGDLAEVLEDRRDFKSHEDLAQPVHPPKAPVRVIHHGATVPVPKPTILVDSREPENTRYRFSRFRKWFSGIEVRKLDTGDYSLAEWPAEISIERKTLTDLVGSVLTNRSRFLDTCARLAGFRRRAIVVEATLAEAKSPYGFSGAHPNAVVGSLFAIAERWDIPIIWAGNRSLAEETVAHLLSKFHILRWLEENGQPRHFVDGDV